MGQGSPHNRLVPNTKEIQAVVGANVRALRKSGLTEHDSILRFAKWTGVPNGTVDRIEKGQTDPQLSHLVKIAAKFPSIRIWHLFVPNLDPRNPPQFITGSELALHIKLEDDYARLRELREGSDTGTFYARTPGDKRPAHSSVKRKR